MSYKMMQIENHLSYRYAGKSKSNKWDKISRNRKVRRKLKINPESTPFYKQYSGWEW